MKKLLIILALFCAANAARAEGVKRYIQGEGVRLLAKPTAFAKSYGTLKKGQIVWAEKGPNGYFKVRVEPIDGQELAQELGYISGRALGSSKPKMQASARKGGNASAEEVAAATKGFNKQVEAQVRSQNAKLDFDLLDRLLQRTQETDPNSATEGFRKSGQLGEYATGGGQ